MSRRAAGALAVAALVLALAVVGVRWVAHRVHADRLATAAPAQVLDVAGIVRDGGGFDVVAQIDTRPCHLWGIWAEPTGGGYAVLVPDQDPSRAFNDGNCEFDLTAPTAQWIPLYSTDESPVGTRITVNGSPFTIRDGTPPS